MKTTIIAIPLLVTIAFVGLAPNYHAAEETWEQKENRRLENYDFQSLTRLPHQETIARLGRLSSIYQDSMRRPDLAIAAGAAAARNPGIPQFMESKIRAFPVTLENLEERGKALFRLEHLPAEWAVRLLARLMIENEPLTSSKYDLSKDEDLMEISRLYDIEVTQMSNAFMAGAVLSGLKMPHWAERPKDMSYRDWLIANEGRLGEFVKAKWGDKAVLNAELGLGPDNLPLAARAANPPATAPAAGQGGWQWPVAGGVALLVLMAVWWWRACGRV